MRGSGLERISASVKQVIHSPLGKHSAKPWEAQHQLELLYSEVSRIELLARQESPGWDIWDNEVSGNSIKIQNTCFNHLAAYPDDP